MTADPDLDRAVEIIIVDAYGDDEQYTAFLTVIEEQTRLPATATLRGTPVTVGDRGIIARCEEPTPGRRHGQGWSSPAVRAR